MLRARCLLLLAWLPAAGCTTTYKWTPGGSTAADVETAPVVERNRWSHLFVMGLIGRSTIDLRDVCPGPVAQGLRTGITVPTTLVAIVTLGVYTPIEHKFSCVVPSPEDLAHPEVILEETAPLHPSIEADADSDVPAPRRPARAPAAPEDVAEPAASEEVEEPDAIERPEDLDEPEDVDGPQVPETGEDTEEGQNSRPSYGDDPSGAKNLAEQDDATAHPVQSKGMHGEAMR